jgi:hypothetical protein
VSTSLIVLPGTSRPGASPAVIRLAQLWRLIPIAFAFSYAASIPIKHSDLFYTLANGRRMVELGQLPLQLDPFTYAPTVANAYDQPWLAQVLFYLAERVGGLAGVSFLHAAAITAAVGVLLWLLGAPLVRPGRAEAAAGSGTAAGLALLGLVLAGTNFNIRPQSLAFLPFVACLAVVRTTGPRQAWAVPVMGLLAAAWANVHGSFTLAILVAATHAAGTAIELVRTRDRATEALLRHRLWLTVAAALGTWVNPAGPGVWLYALSIGGNPVIRQNIQEWWPTTALATLTAQLFVGTLLPILLLLVVRGRRLRAEDVLLLLALGGLAIATQRAVAWWGLAVPAVLARTLTGQTLTRTREVPAINLTLLAALMGVMLLSLPWLRPVNPLLGAELRSGPGGGFLSEDHPSGAVAYLQSVDGGRRVFTRMEWGGYLAWSLWPRQQVFLDARIERHPPDVWRDYFAILAGQPDWEALLERNGGADYLLLERGTLASLAGQVDHSSRWRLVYADDLSLLYAVQS